MEEAKSKQEMGREKNEFQELSVESASSWFWDSKKLFELLLELPWNEYSR
jgi:hypothetical protein